MDRKESQCIPKIEITNLNKDVMLFHSNKEPNKNQADQTWPRVFEKNQSAL